jgi:hypothetical protein
MANNSLARGLKALHSLPAGIVPRFDLTPYSKDSLERLLLIEAFVLCLTIDRVKRWSDIEGRTTIDLISGGKNIFLGCEEPADYEMLRISSHPPGSREDSVLSRTEYQARYPRIYGND